MADYIDAATVTLVAEILGSEQGATVVYNVGDTALDGVVHAGRANVVTVKSLDNNITFKLQVSPDGVTWHDLRNPQDEIVLFVVTASNPVAYNMPPGLFHIRLICTVAADPATCIIRTTGGYA